MACYHPIPAFQDAPGSPVRLLPDRSRGANLALPCQKCLGCRQARATQWGHRADHEASRWEHNSFLTLTYDDDHVPEEGHLIPRDLQLFIKRLRKYADSRRSILNRDRRAGLRYFACGEYGEKNGRPHYHVLLFNAGFDQDAKRVAIDLYQSQQLHELWDKGRATYQPAKAGAAAGYIAKYHLKNYGNPLASRGLIDADGVWKPAPFLRMSLKPGIGNEWLKRYHKDLTHGYLVQNGRKTAIPRAYRTKLKQLDPQFSEALEHTIYTHARDNPTDNNTPERRHDAEIIHKRKIEITTQNRSI